MHRGAPVRGGVVKSADGAITARALLFQGRARYARALKAALAALVR